MDVRTTGAIATISFNTPEYLAHKMDELVKAKKLSFWAFIPHLPEDDEGGRKNHNHLFTVPSKLTQTDDLKAELMEFDPEHPDKPRGTISWVRSDFGNWYLYALHDRRYLASKGQSRKYHYKQSDFYTSDEDDFLYRVRTIDMLSLSPYADMIDAQENGLSWSEYFARGTVPLPQIKLFEAAWYNLLDSKTHRAGRSGHDMSEAPEVDPSTGELIEAAGSEAPHPEQDSHGVQGAAPPVSARNQSQLKGKQ